MSGLEKRKEFIINVLYIFALIIPIYLCLKLFLPVMLPFITAFIIASLCRKAVLFISSKTGLGSRAACAIFTTLLVGVICCGIFFLIYGLIRELTSLSELIEGDAFSSFFASGTSKARAFLQNIISPEISPHAAEIFSWLDGSIEKLVQGILEKLLSVSVSFIKAFPGGVIFAVFTVLSLYYVGFEYDSIVKFLRLQAGEKLLHGFDEGISVFTLTLKRIFKAYVLLTFITFIQLFCGFFVLGLRYCLITSLLVCLVDLIPVLGTGTVLLPWSVLSFISGDIKTGTGLVIIYALITLFRQIAEPKIVGANIGLSPLLSLIAMYSGLKLWGFLGVIVFPIILITIMSLNEKGIIRLYKCVPDTRQSQMHKSKHKFINFKKQDKQ